jgi:hypothetical protein
MNMNIIGTSIHQINHLTEEVVKIDTSAQDNQLNDYIKNILAEINKIENKRLFKFSSETSEVRGSLKDMLNNDFDKGAKTNAERLLRIELEAQEKIKQLPVEIQKGILLQVCIEHDDKINIILTKADHGEYLDEADFQLRSGLALKRKIFKTIVIEIKNEEIDSIFVSDTNTSMSKYWWRDYLELTEVYTDAHNTTTSLDMLDLKILNPIKNKYKADHTILRNSIIGYFRNKEEFDMSCFIESTLQNYTPVDENLDIEKIIEKVKALPQKYKFDTKFTIEKTEIKKRKIQSIMKLNESIDLILNDHIENLGDLIQSYSDEEGNKYVKIKSIEGYERFNTNKINKQNNP